MLKGCDFVLHYGDLGQECVCRDRRECRRKSINDFQPDSVVVGGVYDEFYKRLGVDIISCRGEDSAEEDIFVLDDGGGKVGCDAFSNVLTSLSMKFFTF